MIEETVLSEARTLREGIYDTFSLAEKNYWSIWIKAMFSEFFNSYKTDIKKLTELVIALNHKTRDKFEEEKEDLQEVYNELRERADSYCMDNFKWEELDYFILKTD